MGRNKKGCFSECFLPVSRVKDIYLQAQEFRDTSLTPSEKVCRLPQRLEVHRYLDTRRELIVGSLNQHATQGCFTSPLTPSKGRMGYLLKTPGKSVKVRPFIFVILTICNILYYIRSPITSSHVNPSSVLDISGCSLYI